MLIFWECFHDFIPIFTEISKKNRFCNFEIASKVTKDVKHLAVIVYFLLENVNKHGFVILKMYQNQQKMPKNYNPCHDILRHIIIFSFYHKWNEALLLVINKVYTSYLTSCRTTSNLDLRKSRNSREISKYHGIIA